MTTRDLAWFKSSYSGTQGDSCLEVALSWHKSSYSSGDGDSCVEVASCPDTVHVRDSKDTALPGLDLTPAAWAAFTTHIARD